MVREAEASFNYVAAGDAQDRAELKRKLDEILGTGAGESANNLLDLSHLRCRGKLTVYLAADEANASEQADLGAPRAQRDLATAAAATELDTVRSIVEVVHGRHVAEKLGFSARSPRDANGVYQLGRRFLSEYDRGNLPASSKAMIDLTPTVEKARVETTRLGASLETLVGEEREAQAALLAKDRAMAEYVEAFSDYAGLVSQLLSVAGLDEEARRLRPSKRHAGRSDEVVEPADGQGESQEAPASEKSVG